MPSHRAEQVMVAVSTRLEALSALSISAVRGRTVPDSGTTLPQLNIYQGTEIPVEGAVTSAFLDRELAVHVDVYANAASDPLDTVMNDLRKEVYAALMIDDNLGLPFVQKFTWKQDAAPEDLGAVVPGMGRLAMTFAARYRHSRPDPSA